MSKTLILHAVETGYSVDQSQVPDGYAGVMIQRDGAAYYLQVDTGAAVVGSTDRVSFVEAKRAAARFCGCDAFVANTAFSDDPARPGFVHLLEKL